MTIKGKKLLFLLFFPALLVSLSVTQAGADEKNDVSIDAALYGGVRLLDLEGETYGLKAVPFFGLSVVPRLELTQRFFLSLDMSFSYTLRSNYSGNYYYDSFGTIGFLPELGLLFPGKDVDFSVLAGGGFFISFSEYDRASRPALSFRTGLEFREGFVGGIYISYSHVFAEAYQTYESIKLFAATPLLRRSYIGRD